VYTVAIIVAGGQGKRIGGPVHKQFLEIAGKPVLAHTLQRFQDCAEINEVVLVAPEDWLVYAAEQVVDRYGFDKVRKIVGGGIKRQDSVLQGLQALDSAPDLVAIHDGVRPFVRPDFISRLVQVAGENGAVIPGLRPSETIKRVEHGRVLETLNRDSLIAVQTPQVYAHTLIMRAYEMASREHLRISTDDATLVEMLGEKVYVMDGDPLNIKITTTQDLEIAEHIARSFMS
jgi:2-C-methyl-D-erythritol 4-phosphate cytidylyltransferase